MGNRLEAIASRLRARGEFSSLSEADQLAADGLYLLDIIERAKRMAEYYQHDDQIGKRARDFLRSLETEGPDG